MVWAGLDLNPKKITRYQTRWQGTRKKGNDSPMSPCILTLVFCIVQQQVCRYTVPWALFEESMPPTQISYRYSQLQEKHRWQSEISIDSKWQPIFKMAATR